MLVDQQLTIEPDQAAVLCSIAEEQTCSPDVLVREAISDYIRRQKAEEDDLLQSACESLEEYERTGLHVTGEEADAWLAKLEKGERVPPPECHT